MNHIRPIMLIVALMVSSVGAIAQNLHKLPADKSIARGTLKNGTEYFVVANKSVKGMADFALVQRTGKATDPAAEESKAIDLAHESLEVLPRLSGHSPQSFAARHGVTPGKNGFVKVTDDATVFRFEDLVLSRPEVLDSALLMMLDMVDRVSVACDTFHRRWYAPSDQALVIAGDIDVKDVVKKLELMSYMTPALPSCPRPEYVWNDIKEPVYTVGEDSRNVAVLKLSWRLPRTPKEYMNTVQPVTFESFMSELGNVATDKIRSYLGSRNKSVADVSYEYRDAVSSFSDESFSVTVTVSPDDLADAIIAVAHVMSDIDAGRTDAKDVRRAEKIYFEKNRNIGFNSLHDNTEYMDRCIAAFLYNASLASRQDVMNFHATRAMSDEMRLKLFNSIAAASLDRDRNLTVECRMKDNPYSAEDIRGLFESVWDNPGADIKQDETPTDSLVLPAASAMKIKIRSSKTEHMSGGTVWTLSNGLKVIFKHLPVKDRIFYSLSLNGGYASIRGLEPGEGAYMSDFLDCCRIAGLKSRDFKDFLREEGVTLESKVNLSNTIFSGQIPDNKLELLLQALIAVLNDREVDDEAFCRYVFDESLRPEFQKGSIKGRIAAIDSIMCPDYIYSPYKTREMLAPSFAAKADAFLTSQAGKINDGYLILVGDVDESLLKKLLLQYAGNFRMTDKAFPRTVVRYQPIAGVSTNTIEGSMDSMDMVMSAPVPLTAHNFYLAEIAAMVLKKCIARTVVGMGMYPIISHECRIYPQERFNLMLSLSDVSTEGFAKGTVSQAPLEALQAVRSVLADVDSLEFSDAELSVYKASLKQSVELKKNDPDFWLAMIFRRYLDGKDLYTGYAAEIDSITRKDVVALLSSLCKGSRVEYIVTAK